MVGLVSTNTTSTGNRPAKAFSRVLVGIDGSPESVEAARQAARLTEDQGELTLLAAYDIASALFGGTGVAVPAYLDEEFQRTSAEDVVRAAKEEIADVFSPATKIVRGTSWAELLREAEGAEDTLIAVGSHGTGRALGIVIGSTATEIVHKAPCSVLVARKAESTWPNKIVVGIDGSPESAAAYATATSLAERFAAKLWPVVAHGGKGVDRDRVAAIVDHHHEGLEDAPVPALLAASADADLLVIGSRGLHGFKALGSVSERVAHQAHCSVLVVR
jgi:nucleotide-binding universal stress UspA family protein